MMVVQIWFIFNLPVLSFSNQFDLNIWFVFQSFCFVKFKWNCENFLPLVIFHQFLGSFRVIAAFTSNHLSFPQQRFLLSTSLEIHVKYKTQNNPISETILSVCSLDLMHYSKHFQMFDNSEGSEALGSYMQQMLQILHNFD